MSKPQSEADLKTRVLALKETLEEFYLRRNKQLRSYEEPASLNPTLSEAKLSQFEAQHGFSLSPEYRAYLKYLSNGLESPVGLFPLEKSYPLNRSGLSDEDKLKAFAKVGLPFPYREEEREQHKEQFEALGGWGSSAAEDHGRQGALILADDGCDQLTLLEVTGENPDRLWFDDMANESFLYPIADSFLDWLTALTQRALAEL
ncbi:MAG: SMI1/KNR4 family protein [Bacteroidota bacterium]